jgi:hypothetical protein
MCYKKKNFFFHYYLLLLMKKRWTGINSLSIMTSEGEKKLWKNFFVKIFY